MTESLNKGILSKIVPTDLEVSRQQSPQEDHWEISILLWDMMTLIIKTMIQMSTRLLMKNGSKENMDGTRHL